MFDRVANHEALRNMTEAQRDATLHVHSILSTPIFRSRTGKHDDPIGILNLDSPDSIADTGFDVDTMQDLVMEYAAIIGSFLR